MIRLKLDLGAFDQHVFRQPFWKLERNGISHGTIVEYVQSVLEKNAITDDYPIVYLDGAIIPHYESTQILRDGDLLRIEPSSFLQRRPVELETVPPQPAMEGCATRLLTGVRTPQDQDRFVANAMTTTVAGDNLEANQYVFETRLATETRTPERGERVTTVRPSQEDDQAECVTTGRPIAKAVVVDETEETDECDDHDVHVAGEQPKKKRKRGPRRRTPRSKRMMFEDCDTRPVTDATPMRQEHETTTKEMLAKTPIGTSTEAKVAARNNNNKDNNSKLQAKHLRLDQEECNTESLNVVQSVSELSTTKPDEQVTKGADDKPMMKVSARKQAKRSYGVGDILRMLHNQTDCDTRPASDATPLRQEHESTTKEMSDRAPISSTPIGAKVAAGSSNNNREKAKHAGLEHDEDNTDSLKGPGTSGERQQHGKTHSSLQLDDIQPGCRLHAGLTLFCTKEMRLRFFADVVLEVSHVDFKKRKLSVILVDGTLPENYGQGRTFNVDWAMLDSARLVT